jgi:hypothetical protein
VGWASRERGKRAGDDPLLLIAVTGVQGQPAADHSADAVFDHHLLKPAHPADIFADLAAFIRDALVCPAGVG